MKKMNNKYRNNNNNNNYNQIYSLNYKFDSTSPAGKCSGTALDLIKKYNELAKEAHMNNDYVGAEVFRQYAEHYRKIVTEINERKNQNQRARENENTSISNDNADAPAAAAPVAAVETPVSAATAPLSETPAAPAPVVEKKAFKIIEISEEIAKAVTLVEDAAAKPRRQPRKRAAAV